MADCFCVLSTYQFQLSEREVGSATDGTLKRYVVEVLVRKVPDNQQFIELRYVIQRC